MRIREKGTNMLVTEAIKGYLHKKLAYLEKLIDSADESVICEVELGRTSNHHKAGDIFRTEINLHISGKNFRAVSEMEDLYASIDIAKDEMMRELQTNKDKRVTLIKRGGAKIKNLIKGLTNK